MPKRTESTSTVASVKFAERADPNGRYATCVKDIVKACEDKICLLKEEEVVRATDSAAELEQAVNEWAKTILTAQSLQRIATKACTSIRHQLEHLERQAADISLGETIHWPVSELRPMCRICTEL